MIYQDSNSVLYNVLLVQQMVKRGKCESACYGPVIYKIIK